MVLRARNSDCISVAKNAGCVICNAWRRKKQAPSNTAAGFRLDAEEQAAFNRYLSQERFPLTLSDLAHRVFRDWLANEGLLIDEDLREADE